MRSKIFISTEAGTLYNQRHPDSDVKKIGFMDEGVTDLAMGPDGKLYAITVNSLFKVNQKTGDLKFIANHGLEDANAFDIAEDGTAYIASDREPGLFTVDLDDGSSRRIFKNKVDDTSAGDVVTQDKWLYFANNEDQIVKINTKNGNSKVYDTEVEGVYGLAEADGKIYAYSGDSVYQFRERKGDLKIVDIDLDVDEAVWGATDNGDLLS